MFFIEEDTTSIEAIAYQVNSARHTISKITVIV